MIRMLAAVRLGNKVLHILSDQFRRFVAEHLLGPRVGQCDAAGMVGNDGSVR